MGKLISLDEVNASVLPAKVLVLLSKYAQSMRKHTGLVIKISSMNVFKHVHNTNKLTEHPEVRRLHRDLLVEVNLHLVDGTMQTNQQRYEAAELPMTQRFNNGQVTTEDRSVSSMSTGEGDQSLLV